MDICLFAVCNCLFSICVPAFHVWTSSSIFGLRMCVAILTSGPHKSLCRIFYVRTVITQEQVAQSE